MAKFLSNGMLDGGLTKFGTATRITALSGQPASISDITTDYPTGMKLATTTLAGGDFTLSTPVAGTRRSTVAEKANVTIAVTGTATHVAIDDGTDFAVTTCTSKELTQGDQVTFPEWYREVTLNV
jgi:hypothetical protein